MKTVTYFNTDLKKNVTVQIPVHMNIIPPEKQGHDDLYNYKGIGGNAKTKKHKSKETFNKIKNLIESGQTLEIKSFDNKSRFSNRQVIELLKIAINKGNYKGAEIISFYM
jgi:anti-sigma28 factor (negative regulator of flagellin synthesis)